MKNSEDNHPKNVSELIDHIEQIREELLTILKTMEKMERPAPVLAGPREI
jgi:hypothetical protein